MKFVSAFEASTAYGGGVITKKLIKLFKINENLFFRINSENILIRYLRIIFIWFKTPFLHPIFCAYPAAPICDDSLLLNFSQTFNLVFRNNFDCYLIVHDVIVQKRLFINSWISYSEKKIFKKCKLIYVLSDKDKKLIRRFYKIPNEKIINIYSNLFSSNSFSKTLIRKKKWNVFFLGSLDRNENYTGFDWFYKNVYHRCSEYVDVSVVGVCKKKFNFPGIDFVGYVDDLDDLLRTFDFSIAPIIEGAGVKIKVSDALKNSIPVLGTYKAYEGYPKPSDDFLTNNPEKWIAVLSSEILHFEI